MHLRRTILHFAAKIFGTARQSSELREAYNSYKTLYQQGRYAEADPYAKEALRLNTEEFGPNDPTTATLLNNLAEIYRAQGRCAEAEPLHQRALTIREKALGPEHPDVAGSLNNLAIRGRGRPIQVMRRAGLSSLLGGLALVLAFCGSYRSPIIRKVLRFSLGVLRNVLRSARRARIGGRRG